MVDKASKLARVPGVFTPGAPVNTLALFAGRVPQVLDVINAVGQRGQHVALYGERGVGKTSLANVLSDIFADKDLPRLNCVRVNCDTAGDFESLWKMVLRELNVIQNGVTGFSLSPEDIRYTLQDLDHTVIVIDELDRLEDDEALSLLADTIKTLSDHSVNTTLMLVGVADSVLQLVGDHRSIERALVQVPMPRMEFDELADIIDRGLQRLNMGIDPAARARIARLSEGLPFYTHLLALHSTQRAIIDDRTDVKQTDVDGAIQMAVQKVGHTILSEYQLATRSPRRDSLFREVLLACALAPKDDLGYFTTGGVRGPLSRILNRPIQIPAFAKHLGKFTDEGRGYVLQMSGEPWRHFYRFANPLLQPFVILRGLSDGLIDEALLLEIEKNRTGAATSADSSGPQQQP